MQVGGKTADLQLAEYLWICRIGQINRKQGICLAEGYKVTDISEKPGGTDCFVVSKSFNLADLL